MTVFSGIKPIKDAEILHFAQCVIIHVKLVNSSMMQKCCTWLNDQIHSNLLNPTVLQKLCTFFNDTQICWTQQRCRNSAPCSMCNYICKFSGPINDAEILRPVQWLNTLKSSEPNNDAEILHFVQRHSNLLNPTTMQKFCSLFNV